MTLSRLPSAALLAAIVMTVACGDDGDTPIDAPKVFLDAKEFMDAPPVTGLGARCSSPADCPANAPECVTYKLSTGASPMYCTPKCLEGATMTTTAGGNVTATTPAPDNAKCTAAYTGGVLGGPTCANWLSWTPMHTPFMGSTTYTNITWGCVVLCTNNNTTCPAGMSCINGGCFPM